MEQCYVSVPKVNMLLARTGEVHVQVPSIPYLHIWLFGIFASGAEYLVYGFCTETKSIVGEVNRW